MSLNPFKILIAKKISNISPLQSINFNILIVFNLILLISFFNQTLDNIFYGVIVYFIILFSVNIFYIKQNNLFLDPKLILFFLLCIVIFLSICEDNFLLKPLDSLPKNIIWLLEKVKSLRFCPSKSAATVL